MDNKHYLKNRPKRFLSLTGPVRNIPYKKNKISNGAGFTLLEVLTVIIIIGILATLGLTNYTKTRENTFDKEAITILKVMQSAEKDYALDNNDYQACSGVSDCNSKLGLIISSQQWNLVAGGDPPGMGPFYVTTTRLNPPSGHERYWQLEMNETEPTLYKD